MRRFLSFILAHRSGVVLVAALAFAIGIWILRNAPLEVFPDFAPSTITVQTEAPGFAVDQVEQLVTTPVEAALAGAAGLDTIRSSSIPGLSVRSLAAARG